MDLHHRNNETSVPGDNVKFYMYCSVSTPLSKSVKFGVV